MIKVDVDIEGLTRARALLSHMPGAFERAKNAAMSRTLAHMRTLAGQLGSEKYYAKSSEIKRSIITRRSNNAGAMISRGTRKSLADYYLSPRKQKLGRKQGKLKGAVKRNGIKALGKAFLVPIGGKYLPYYRVGKGRWDIRRLISPAIPQILGNEEITEKISSEALSKYNERLNHEILRQLGVYAK